MEDLTRVKLSFNLLRLEILMSTMLISLPILNLFWRDYAGMDQFAISVSQAVFMVVMIIMDIPTGVIADKFSRKWANTIGDLIVGFALVGYAFANTLVWVIVAEIVFALGLALSSGADGPLLEQYCEKLGLSFEREQARIQKIAPLTAAVAVIIGGILGGFNIRLTMLVTSVPLFIGTICSLLLVEDKTWLGIHGTYEKRRMRDEVGNTLRGTKEVIIYSMHGHKELASSIWTRAILNESTHGLVWITTPLLLIAGVPIWLVGAGWAGLNVSASIGAALAQRYSPRLSTRRVLSYSLAPFVTACLIMGLNTNQVTITLIAVFGLMRGWQQATMPARVQALAPKAIKTSALSVSSTLSRLIYIPLVLLIGQSGTRSPSEALMVNAVIFAIAGLALYPRLKRHEA